jgi:L-asparaginase type II
MLIGRGILWCLAWVVSLRAGPRPAAQAEALPRVLVITTGGTIALRGEQITAIPGLTALADVSTVDFIRGPSSRLTPDHWLRLSKLINQSFRDDPDLAGVVVTHGTDTLEECSFFLHLTVRDRRPVVVVGAMRNATNVSADGPVNLLNAVRVAIDPEAGGKGVLILLNDEINSARDAVKTDANRLHTFRSLEYGALGVADPDTVVFRRAPTTRHTVDSEFDILDIDSLPPVAIVTDYAGADGDLVKLAAEHSQGLVVTGFPSASLSAGTMKAVLEAAGRGVPVVIHSRAISGRARDYYPQFAAPASNPPKTITDIGIIVGRDFTPHRARILLMLALTKTKNPRRIQRMFDTY